MPRTEPLCAVIDVVAETAATHSPDIRSGGTQASAPVRSEAPLRCGRPSGYPSQIGTESLSGGVGSRSLAGGSIPTRGWRHSRPRVRNADQYRVAMHSDVHVGATIAALGIAAQTTRPGGPCSPVKTTKQIDIVRPAIPVAGNSHDLK